MVVSTLNNCQKTDELMYIELSVNYAHGKDGFKYQLTKNEFLTPFDIPIAQLQAKYGEETIIADWNDLEANFEDDFIRFLNGIGFADSEKHEGFFIKKDSQNLFLGKSPYMVTGRNNQQHSSRIILDRMETSELVVASQFDVARVLVKIKEQ